MSDDKERYEVCCGSRIPDALADNEPTTITYQHIPKKVEGISIPTLQSLVDEDYKNDAQERIKKGLKDLDGYSPSSATVNNHMWHKRFLGLADYVAQWSKDKSTKCGSVIVDNKQRIVSLGYNGFSRGVHDTNERLDNRELKYELIIHAEMNSLMFANRPLDDCTIYVTPLFSCSRCASMIIQSGITMVVAPKLSDELAERWGESIILSKQIFDEAKVKWLEI